MCIKKIKTSVKIIEQNNRETGSDNFCPLILLVSAGICIVVGVAFKIRILFIYAIVLILSGAYLYFRPLIFYKVPFLRKLDSVLVFTGLPIISFYTGVSFCTLYFEQISNKFTLIFYAAFTITTALLFASIYLVDAIKHFKELNKTKLDIYFLLFELYQIIHFFAVIYSTILIIDHSSFTIVKATSPLILYLDMFYFSTVTFTTLGYGDIVPTNPIAKMVVVVEVFLFAIVISLVVVNLAKRTPAKETTIEDESKVNEKQE